MNNEGLGDKGSRESTLVKNYQLTVKYLILMICSNQSSDTVLLFLFLLTYSFIYFNLSFFHNSLQSTNINQESQSRFKGHY